MSAQLTGWDKVVAQACAKVYTPSFNPGVIVRRVLWNVAAGVGLALAALELDGYLSVFMWVLVGLRVLPYLFTGLAQRVKDEHMARLALMTPSSQMVLQSSTRLARDWQRGA